MNLSTKTKLLALALMVMLTLKAEAQTQSNKFEIGGQVSQYQNDFGIGLHLISPYFLQSTLAIKAGVNFQWFESFNGINETTWTPYQNFQVGIRSRSAIVVDKIYIYGEGGSLIILPNSDFSSETVHFGGYGLFGFEFRPVYNFAYYIELGGVGTGAVADKAPAKPIYSNGFLTNVGFRIGF